MMNIKEKKYVVVLLLCFFCAYSIVAQTVAPSFSVNHGLYDEPFQLSISCKKDSLAVIYYTTDGTVPSVENGHRYSSPLTISGTTVLRAVAVNASGAGKVKTATYLFLDDVLRQDNAPEGYPSEWGKYASRSGTAKADYEMDPDMTSDPEFCKLLKEGFRSLPIISVVTDPSHLFNKEENDSTGGIYIYTGAPNGSGKPGRGWERPVSFEIFDASGIHDFQANCGIKIHGGHSRLPEKSPKHSFRLVFRDAYGPKKLKYPLFGESGPSQLNAVVLRTAFCNSWHHQDADQREIAVYSRDMWAKRTQKAMGHLTTNGLYAHLFINGLYWGLYNPTERIDDDFCELHLGGDKSEYDVIKVEEYGTSHTVEADAGTMDKWNELFSLADDAADMKTYLKMQGLDEEGIRDPLMEPLLDADNFIDYMLINYYGGNSDWDSHNWLAVRNRQKGDHGFHFLCWDSEHILKKVSDNVLDKKTSLSPTYLFRKLMDNRLFKRRFFDRVQKHCFDRGLLTPDSAASRWLSLDAMIDTALYCEQARWGDYRRDVHKWTSKGELYTVESHYTPQRTFLLDTYFPQRTEAFISQLEAKGWFPDVDAPVICFADEPALFVDTLDADDALTLSGDGTIYYTLDGTSPVSWFGSADGEVTSSAVRYDASHPITSDKDFILKAIAYDGGQWSAVREQRFSVRPPVDGMSHLAAPDCSLRVSYADERAPVVRFHLSSSAAVSLSVYTLHGTLVHQPLPMRRLWSGPHGYALPAGLLPSGVYLCRLTVDGRASHVKVVVR